MSNATDDLENPTIEVDARGLQCPMPMVRASKAAKEAKAGDVLRVRATDRGSVPDFQAWVSKRPEYVLLKQEEQTGEDGKTVYVHYLKRIM